MNPDRPNESAVTYRWLIDRLGLDAATGQGRAGALWTRYRDRMRAHVEQVVNLEDWTSDFWLCRGIEFQLDMLGPSWSPPDRIDEWPGARKADPGENHTPNGSATNHERFLKQLDQGAKSVFKDNTDALEVLARIKSQIAAPVDARKRQFEHIRAWTGSSTGHLLFGVIFSPHDDHEFLMRLTMERLYRPLETAAPVDNSFEDRRLEQLYNFYLDTDTGALITPHVRSGQGEHWGSHWNWFAQELDVELTLEALQVAAGVLRSEPLIDGLLKAAEAGKEPASAMSVGVIRRMLINLKAMAWLEEALCHEWTDVQVQDLVAFAFNASKPDWPRRELAVSHRSADLKPILMNSPLWNSPRCAIDACYTPSWESNLGMMWGLFSQCRVIARVNSPGYLESLWCRRESELIDYLRDRSDFMKDRLVVDVDSAEIAGLEAITRNDPEPGIFKTFPPPVMVTAPQPKEPWEVAMLRAAGALRLICVVTRDSRFANRIARDLAEGRIPAIRVPTSNLDGWDSYARVFKDVLAVSGETDDPLPVRLPDDYGLAQQKNDLDLALRVPDLSSGVAAIDDILVAFEWFRTELTALQSERDIRRIVINCQHLNEELWSTDPRLSHLRGIAALWFPYPVWFLQRAGQDVENWPFVGNRPIFTEYLSSQFAWMMETFFDPKDARKWYPQDSRMILSDKLEKLCAGQG